MTVRAWVGQGLKEMLALNSISFVHRVSIKHAKGRFLQSIRLTMRALHMASNCENLRENL